MTLGIPYNESVYSPLAADPDLGELVALFVEEMPERIAAMEACAYGRNWGQLGRIAHQLKGAAGGYGFDAITPEAARLERAVQEHRPEDQVLAALEELVRLCRHLRPGTPQS